MHFTKILTQLLTLSKLSEGHIHFPLYLQSDSDCFVNIVSSEDHDRGAAGPGYDDKRLQATFPWISYTFHTAGQLRFNFDDEDLQNENGSLSISSGYFRSGQKYRNPCILFFLLLTQFEEATTAIRRSGFGTSDTAIFFIYVKGLEDQLVQSFVHNLYTGEGSTPFHAQLLFVDHNSLLQGEALLGQFCYFCPSPEEKIHLIRGLPTRLELKLGNRINTHGHNRKMYLMTPDALAGLNSYERFDPCMNIFKGHHDTLEQLNSALKLCPEGPVYVATSALQSVYNVSFLLDPGAFTEVARLEENWFLQIRFGESLMKFPNEYLVTRGMVDRILFDKGDLFICCSTIRDLTVTNYNIFSSWSNSIWISLASVGLAYSLLYKNIFKGMDLTWAFIGGSYNWEHRDKRLIATSLILATIFSLTFSSYISADAMSYLSFPTLVEFLRDRDYTLEVDNRLVVLVWLQFLPKDLKRTLKGLLQGNGKELEKNWVSNAHPWHNYSSESVPEMLHWISSKKVAVGSSNRLHKFELMNTPGVVAVERKYLCKRMSFGKDFGVTLFASYRSWSYMSERAILISRRWTEAGWMSKLEGLSKFANSDKRDPFVDNSVQVDLVDRWTEPQPISLLDSALGMCCLCHCVFVAVLALTAATCWVVGWLRKRKCCWSCRTAWGKRNGNKRKGKNNYTRNDQ